MLVLPLELIVDTVVSWLTGSGFDSLYRLPYPWPGLAWIVSHATLWLLLIAWLGFSYLLLERQGSSNFLNFLPNILKHSQLKVWDTSFSWHMSFFCNMLNSALVKLGKVSVEIISTPSYPATFKHSHKKWINLQRCHVYISQNFKSLHKKYFITNSGLAFSMNHFWGNVSITNWKSFSYYKLFELMLILFSILFSILC